MWPPAHMFTMSASPRTDEVFSIVCPIVIFLRINALIYHDTSVRCVCSPYRVMADDKEVTDGPVTTYQGHATQILWKDTQEVGCAVESCEKIEQSRTWRYSVLVCNYNPT